MSAKVANPSSKENVFLFIPNLIGKVNKCTCLLLIQCNRIYANYFGILVFILYARTP
jgi:hypothetical protein